MNHSPKRYRSIILLFSSILFLLSEAFPAPIINEFVALNRSTLYDEDGQSSDWIEIHNPHPNTIDLAGHFLTNDRDDLKKWEFSKISLFIPNNRIVVSEAQPRTQGVLRLNLDTADNL